ncbi:SigE family RNA polymerase sigma factor [Streptomyces sp. NPDC091371]|uniref:SigE family RNA polymerase sigma factor n=1 Tax=Streptomyces sp. NPDC091371 TaxID=3155303 RepID=UPI00344089A3
MQGNDEHFEEFVHVHHQALLKFGRLLTRDWHTGEDLLQAALVKVHRRWRDSAVAEFPLAYTKRVMVTTCTSWRARRWCGELPTARLPDTPAPDETARRLGTRDTLAQALSRLPVEQRIVLVLRFYEDMTLQETADFLNCPPGTVKSRTNRALRSLRESGAIDQRVMEER